MDKDASPILQFFNESDTEVPLSQADASRILALVEQHEAVTFEMVELVYVDEAEIVRINKEHLDRDYVTDIISFRYDDGEAADDNSAIEGTLFCCAPRIAEQANEFGEPIEQEFQRIFIHGLLHLVGYDDSSKDEKQRMTDLENKYLSLSGNNN